jgi:hypothetical protein
MRRFLAIAVSVKSGMTILVKRESLSFKGRPKYKRAMQTPIFGIASQAMAVDATDGSKKDASL